MHIIKFGTSPGDFIGPFAFRSEAEQYAAALSRGAQLPVAVLPLYMPMHLESAFNHGNDPRILQAHMLKQVLEN